MPTIARDLSRASPLPLPDASPRPEEEQTGRHEHGTPRANPPRGPGRGALPARPRPRGGPARGARRRGLGRRAPGRGRRPRRADRRARLRRRKVGEGQGARHGPGGVRRGRGGEGAVLRRQRLQDRPEEVQPQFLVPHRVQDPRLRRRPHLAGVRRRQQGRRRVPQRQEPRLHPRLRAARPLRRERFGPSGSNERAGRARLFPGGNRQEPDG